MKVLARNDNDQFDPGISSLYDFTQGVLGELGDQYYAGLVEHRPPPQRKSLRLLRNAVGIHEEPHHWNWPPRIQRYSDYWVGRASGLHQRWRNPTWPSRISRPRTGLIPIGHPPDYPVSLGEKYKLKLAFDMFNVTNSRFLTAKDQDTALAFIL